MRVCYWGTYDKDYPRNRILISGLSSNQVEVVECNTSIWQDTAEKLAAASSSWLNLKVVFRWLFTYFELVMRFATVRGIDFIIIGYSGHFDVFIARILSRIRKVPLVFDAFLSLHDSLVHDRKIVRNGSLKARLLSYTDKYSCKLADLVLLDTNQHIDYFVSAFGLPEEKFRRIFIGADDSIFFPHQDDEPNNPFTVIHFGKYIPLHGMTYIIRAAKELEDYNIHFQLIGSGDEYALCVDLANQLRLKKVAFIEFLNQEELTGYINKADVCLGVFGDTEKAKRVVPNKVYEAMAMKKPLITGDSNAAREILSHEENCLLCEMQNPHALAEAIVRLKHNKVLRSKIAAGAYTTYRNNCSPLILGKQLKDVLIGHQALFSGQKR